MKQIIIILFFTLAFNKIQAQESNYKIGDDVEYFDGLNWLDSKIVQVGGNGQFLVYTNKAQTTTKWFKADDLQPLFKEAITITEKKVEIIEFVNEGMVDTTIELKLEKNSELQLKDKFELLKNTKENKNKNRMQIPITYE